MIKPDDPRELVENLLSRSGCSVQVASVITDPRGAIVAWGWNSMGPTGYGLCAERHALSRVNRNRIMFGGQIYVAGQYKRNARAVHAKPCDLCMEAIKNNKLYVFYRDRSGEWKLM